jgi:uncharacterized iron-regulated protein
MKRLLVLLPLAAAATALVLPGFFPPPQVIRTGDGARMSFAEMIGEVSAKRAVFVGENHDLPRHHRIELKVIRSLHERKIPTTVALEMFPSTEQRELDRWIGGESTSPELVSAFRRNWGEDWRLYRDIFVYARDNRIPMIGINIPHEIVRKVSKEGFAALGDREKGALPPGVACSFGPGYMDFVRRVYREHRLEGSDFRNFCEAQMLWNKGMAWNLGKYLEKEPGRTVVVLTGTAHAVKEGIPGHVAGAHPGSTAVILPDCPAAADRRQVTLDADYLVLR